MITIIEDTPKKISGLTSLFLTCPYNESITNLVKSLDLAVWHKKDKAWELPINTLSYLLDNLAYIDVSIDEVILQKITFSQK